MWGVSVTVSSFSCTIRTVCLLVALFALGAAHIVLKMAWHLDRQCRFLLDVHAVLFVVVWLDDSDKSPVNVCDALSNWWLLLMMVALFFYMDLAQTMYRIIVFASSVLLCTEHSLSWYAQFFLLFWVENLAQMASLCPSHGHETHCETCSTCCTTSQCETGQFLPILGAEYCTICIYHSQLLGPKHLHEHWSAVESRHAVGFIVTVRV